MQLTWTALIGAIALNKDFVMGTKLINTTHNRAAICNSTADSIQPGFEEFEESATLQQNINDVGQMN